MLGCLLGISLRLYGNLLSTADRAGFYGLDSGITREQMEKYLEDSPQASILRDMALFEIKEEILLTNPLLNRSVPASFGEAAGNMNLIVPGTLEMGNFPVSDDVTGCVISRRTAETLYSSRDALGETLVVDGTDYIVRGILRIDKELCLVQGGKDVTYSNLCVQAPGLPLSALQQQMAGLLPPEAAVISEGGLYRGIGSLLLWLPASTLLCCLMQVMGVLSRKIQLSFVEKPWGALLCSLLGQLRLLLGLGAEFGILFGCLHFSDDYVPTAWSDFSFWRELFSRKAESILTLIKEPLLLCDLRMLASLGGIAVLAVPEALLLLLWFRQNGWGEPVRTFRPD